MTDEEALKRWPDLDPKERARRKKLSEDAKARHAQINPETGLSRFGGPQPGAGRPRKQTIGEKVSELAEGSRSGAVVKALFSGLGKRNDPKVRVATAEKIVRISQREEDLKIKARDSSDTPKDALIKSLGPIVVRMLMSGELDLAEFMPADADVVDGTAEEITDGEDEASAA